MNAFDTIEKYAREIENDTQVDASNIMEKQLSSPNVKHKWLYRVVQAKRHVIGLREKKADLIAEKLAENKLQLSDVALKKQAEKLKEVVQINKEIEQHELLIEYLDRAVEKIFSQMGFDFRNLVELLKLEQL